MAEFMNVPGFFDGFSQAVQEDLMTSQLAANQPEPRQGIFTTSDPLLPDRLVADRLAHFDPDIYDLRDQSHLMKLFKVLLGGAGLGGLRRQAAVIRMQGMFSGMHFLDLDHFYGALFGIQRTVGETYEDQNFNPYLDATDASTWDAIHAQDAGYRSRLVKFAKAIPLGGTYIGLKTMVEALLGAPCEIYESWAMVDEQAETASAPGALSYTFQLLENTADSWFEMEGATWGTWGGGAVQTSRLGTNTRADIVIQPKRDITTSEEYQLMRTVSRFRPAGTSVVVSPMGVALHSPIVARNATANSEYWEVTSKILPNVNLSGPPEGFYPSSELQSRPAFGQYQSEEWSYNGDIASVSSYAMDSGQILYRGNDELVTYSDGTQHHYSVDDAAMTPAEALSAKLVSDGVLTTGAYSVARGQSSRVVVTS